MQRSKLVMGGADAGAGGMSISSGSGGASGMGASSSPYVASAMAQPTGSSGVDVPGQELAFGVELGGVSDGSFELVVAVCSQATRQVLLAEVRDCARCPFGRRLAPPCLVHGQAVE